jgi:hypothetical protein
MDELWENDVFLKVFWNVFVETLGFEPDSGEKTGLVSTRQPATG